MNKSLTLIPVYVLFGFIFVQSCNFTPAAIAVFSVLTSIFILKEIKDLRRRR